MGDGTAPLVPYASYQEFEGLMTHLLAAYGAMVGMSVRGATMAATHGLHSAQSWDVRLRWSIQGEGLFRALTKGVGGDWDARANQAVVQALDVAIRVLGRAYGRHGHLLSLATPDDVAFVCAELQREARLAIVDTLHAHGENSFRHHNFKCIIMSEYAGDDYYDDEEGGAHEYPWFMPMAVVEEMKLAFAMVVHPRLGAAASGRSLGLDMVKHILSEQCFLDNDIF